MNLNELSEALDMPPRQIRYLMAEGILPPSSETGRNANGFTEEHLKLGRRYKRLLDAGMGVRALKAMAAIDDESTVYADDRFELRLRRPDALDDLGDAEVKSILKDIKQSLAHAIGTRKGKR